MKNGHSHLILNITKQGLIMSNDIYSYIKENFGIEITDYQFKRDYIKEPLKQFLNKKGKTI